MRVNVSPINPPISTVDPSTNKLPLINTFALQSPFEPPAKM